MSNISEVPSINDNTLNENLKAEVNTVIQLEKSLEELVKQRDQGKEKAEKISELNSREMGDHMVESLLELVENVRKIEIEIDSTKESLQKLENEDPGEAARDFNTKLDAIRGKLSAMKREREAKEVIYKTLLNISHDSVKLPIKPNHSVKTEVVDDLQ
ncbi:unnamed protein product [Bursaphelenchus okinawaensis]|uniref:Uncharacterized protein n=1 Tax=Bursaphelenchus okinawaensis TaxID=465554 RepID=A0A811LDK9_9BILA|nr:unnamed protein product [Bursaphelenchus okinawaensis]CAG9120487.1 unnamed protein product [Bursaphelenchus okinawaensis]